MGQPDYVTALETRRHWARWMRTSESFEAFTTGTMTKNRGVAYDVRVAHSVYRDALERADTFVMVPEFCRLVEHARQSVPMDLAFDPKWIQAPHGWLWISDPPALPRIVGQAERDLPDMGLVLQAVSWSPIPPGTGVKNAFGVLQADAGWFSACMYVTSPNHHVFLPWSYPVMRPGATIAQRIDEFERDAAEKDRLGMYAGERPPTAAHEVAWFYVAQYLMSQRVATTARYAVDRATRRRYEHDRAVPPDFVKVITLRRLENARASGRSVDVDWRWQWEVRKHKRLQYYPSTGTHKEIEIAAYIKGPSDKPLKPATSKLFVARR